jgi:hypothetical protein
LKALSLPAISTFSIKILGKETANDSFKKAVGIKIKKNNDSFNPTAKLLFFNLNLILDQFLPL